MRTLLATLALCLVLPAAASAAGPQAPAPTDPNPLLGQTWWVDHQWSVSWQDQLRLQREGHPGQAALVRKIAEQPQFVWYGKWAGAASPARRLRKDLARFAEQSPGSVPLLVTKRHESARCGHGYTGGGAKADAQFVEWIRGFAAAVGDRRVVVEYEPDVLGTLDCIVPGRRAARLRTLAAGVDILSSLPNATVYLDAGASDWEGVSTTARKLRAIGVAKVRGFALNATHQDWTWRNVAFGTRLSRALGGKHFVVNTSHNGNGPMHHKVWISRKRHLWRVDTPNSVVGPRPTTATGNPLVDAYLWIERPGYSNGACNGGPAHVGAWWRAKALKMAKGAHW
jgi:endoglucanase